MEKQNAITFSEVNSFLEALGEKYIRKIPTQMLNLIKKKKDSTYNPKYNLYEDIREQGISRESLALIALIDLNYWATEEEKNTINQKLNNNFKKSQKELREKYNPDDIFKKKNKVEYENTEETAITVIQEEKWYKKIFYIIKNYLKNRM